MDTISPSSCFSLPLPDGMCVGARAVVLLQPGCSQAACKVLEGLEHVVLSLLAAGLKVLSLQKKKMQLLLLEKMIPWEVK